MNKKLGSIQQETNSNHLQGQSDHENQKRICPAIVKSEIIINKILIKSRKWLNK